MHELKQVRQALAAAHARGEAVMVATVTGIDGSVYRGVGARMVVHADGTTVGAVSGGCLEADVVARYEETVAHGRAMVTSYDTRAGDDVVMGLGLGCQGVITLLLEPLSGDALRDALSWYDALSARRAPVVVATVIGTTAGSTRRVGEHLIIDRGDDATLPSLREEGLVVSTETIRPPAPLVICGGGTDAIPVAALASSLGWHVTVVDHRPAFATRERFPDADEIVRVNVADDPAALARAVTLDRHTAAVCMAHSAAHDRAYLHALLAAGAGYIGVLGPRRRTMELLGAARPDALTTLPPGVHSPVGLDLGAETPEEIALAIVAEVAAVRNGRQGGMLLHRPGPIHTDRNSS